MPLSGAFICIHCVEYLTQLMQYTFLQNTFFVKRKPLFFNNSKKYVARLTNDACFAFIFTLLKAWFDLALGLGWERSGRIRKKLVHMEIKSVKPYFGQGMKS